MAKGNYQPRGTSQTTNTSGNFYYPSPTAGDTALLQQNSTYELLSQEFVGSISATKDGVDITTQAQNALLAINVQLTSASAQAYQPTATAQFWSNGITDWLATYNAQVAYAKAQGW